jgi:hypothetical protein
MSPSRQRRAESYREQRAARRPYAGLTASGMIERAFPTPWPPVHTLPKTVRDAEGREHEPAVHDRLEQYWSPDKTQKVWEIAGCTVPTDAPEGARGEDNRLPNGKRWPSDPPTEGIIARESAQEAVSAVMPKLFPCLGAAG